jgi:recombination protein RecA
MSDWMSRLTKNFGDIATDMPSIKDSVLPFGSPSLNWAVGNGGIPEGKGVCFYGPESAGKSLMAQLMLIEIQKKHADGIVMWFDAEYSFNKDWFAKLGGDVNRLIVRQSNDPTKIFDYIWGEMHELLQDGAPIKGMVIDSIKSILYPGDIKEVSTKITMGGSGAKYLGPAFKRILPVVREFNITTGLVQQVYEQLDPMKAMRNPYLIPDGRSLKHWCDLMLEVTKIETKKGSLVDGKNMMGSDAQVGHTVRVKCKKNRVGAPARVAQFKLNYEEGIVDVGEELFDLAESLGVVYHPISASTGRPSNMLWAFGEHPHVKGKDNMIQAISDDIVLYSAIIDACTGVNEEAVTARNEIIGVELNDDDI